MSGMMGQMEADIKGTLGAMMSIAATLEAGRAQAKSDKYNAEALDNAADTTDQQAAAAGETLDRSIRRSMGVAHANYGASGVDMSVGSPLTALADASRQGTLDKLTSQYNFDVQAQSYREQAKQYRIGAKNAKRGALLKALMNGLSAQAGARSSGNAKMYGKTNKPSGLQAPSNMLDAGWGTGGDLGSPYSPDVSWPGMGGNQWSGGNSLTGDSDYTGPGSTSTSWPGMGGSWM